MAESAGWDVKLLRCTDKWVRSRRNCHIFYSPKDVRLPFLSSLFGRFFYVRVVYPSFIFFFFYRFRRGEWRGMFLQSDVILETVTYGGVVNAACHGVGQTQVGSSNKRQHGASSPKNFFCGAREGACVSPDPCPQAGHGATPTPLGCVPGATHTFASGV